MDSSPCGTDAEQSRHFRQQQLLADLSDWALSVGGQRDGWETQPKNETDDEVACTDSATDHPRTLESLLQFTTEQVAAVFDADSAYVLQVAGDRELFRLRAGVSVAAAGPTPEECGTSGDAETDCVETETESGETTESETEPHTETSGAAADNSDEPTPVAASTQDRIPIEPATQLSKALESTEPVLVEELASTDQLSSVGEPVSDAATSGIAVRIGTSEQTDFTAGTVQAAGTSTESLRDDDGDTSESDENDESGESDETHENGVPWGVLTVHTTAECDFTDADAAFLTTVANVLASTLDRTRAQRRRDEATTWADSVLDATPVGITLVDTDGMNVFANRRAEEITGRPLSELRTFTHDDERWGLVDDNGNPISFTDLPFTRVIETEEPVRNEVVGISRPSGERVWLSIHCSPLYDSAGEFDGVIYAFRDVTERRELESRLEEILGRVEEAICAFDEDFRYTHVNDRAEELLQRSPEELLGEQLWEVFPESANEDVVRNSFEEAMNSQEPTSYEHYYEPANAWLEVTIYPSETGASVYFRDVTDRREYRRRLEESNERLEQFAYAASHDLQEPLRMVSSYLELLESRYADELDQDAQEFIEYAVDGADRMREMINGLLEFSRVETQGEPFEPVDLDEVLEDVVRDLRVKIVENDADISAEELPRVAGDGNQLRQVFQNLLSNAIAYSGEEPPEIDIAAHDTGSEWVISVSDEGTGIDPDDTDRIFGLFQRRHAGDEHTGSGIGLALCRRIIKRHDGEIWVDSELGEGATFSFTLPTRLDTVDLEPIESGSGPGPESESGSEPKPETLGQETKRDDVGGE
ncbi:multi-sensor signal transduction histidine kinase [Natrialba hulunbeirensis JCM 10989]|uniref:histidine kinase n=1 Tax=Natrialba hulunbeirensis JCM 10989 TaxID=1227493 RepID=L9ZN30_9EURY|nr:PAS domain-containing protein [Natrialba hulunbeirensis]ELY87779.1 multi-sensor signal transduction histidine kinase [Natrialba hulunbeirensis JCM 10989]